MNKLLNIIKGLCEIRFAHHTTYFIIFKYIRILEAYVRPGLLTTNYNGCRYLSLEVLFIILYTYPMIFNFFNVNKFSSYIAKLIIK